MPTLQQVHLAAESARGHPYGRIGKGEFVRWVLQPLSASVPRGNAEMYRQSVLVVSREEGVRYAAGFTVPVLIL